MGMIEANRIRAEKAVEIDQLPVVRCVEKVGAVALVEVNDDLESIEQDVLGDLPEMVVGAVTLVNRGTGSQSR